MAFQNLYNTMYPRPSQKPETQGTEPTQNRHPTPLQEEPQQKRGLLEETLSGALLVVSSNLRFFGMKLAIEKNHNWLNPLSIAKILKLSSARIYKKMKEFLPGLFSFPLLRRR